MISASGLAGAGLVGIGLRAPHLAEIIATPPPIGWLEVHTENYLGGGAAPRALARIRSERAISLHGVGLSLGSAEGLDRAHLARVVELNRRIEPALVSEHLSWSSAGGAYLNHLLPLPYTEESLALVAAHVTRAQEALGRPLLVENPSSYLRFRDSPIGEPEFLAELARRTGCGLLLDVNNIFVTCSNLVLDANAYFEALSGSSIGEIHLAGHSCVKRGGATILIDDHASIVCESVWRLYEEALTRFSLVPSLVEWDKQLPTFETLLDEARKAERIATARTNGHARVA